MAGFDPVGRNDLLMRLMSATSLRAKVLAGNVANQNVPGYKRQVVEFENLISQELQRGRPNLDKIEPQIITDTQSPARADGNNVFMEDEVSAMKENRMLYELYASILTNRLSLMRRAIEGDR